MSKKISVYYGSEENAYEPDMLGRFDNLEDAKRCVADNLADDFSTAEEIAEAVSQITDGGYEGENGQGYHIMYLIGEENSCLSVLYGWQEDFLEEEE